MIFNKDKEKDNKDNNHNQSSRANKEPLLKRYIKNVKNIFQKKNSE